MPDRGNVHSRRPCAVDCHRGSSPLRNPEGEITGVIVARDLTERKQTEARLREYERVVEGLDEKIMVVDREYRYVIANRTFLQLSRLGTRAGYRASGRRK